MDYLILLPQRNYRVLTIIEPHQVQRSSYFPQSTQLINSKPEYLWKRPTQNNRGGWLPLGPHPCPHINYLVSNMPSLGIHFSNVKHIDTHVCTDPSRFLVAPRYTDTT